MGFITILVITINVFLELLLNNIVYHRIKDRFARCGFLTVDVDACADPYTNGPSSSDRLIIRNHYWHHAQHIMIGLGQPIKLSHYCHWTPINTHIDHCGGFGLIEPKVSKVCALILLGSRRIYDFIVFIATDYMCSGSIARWIVSIIHSLMI